MDEHVQHDPQHEHHAGAPQGHDPHAAHDGQVPQRRRLGRGLNALLGGDDDAAHAAPAPAATDGELQYVELDRIDRNPFQPRRDFGEESLAELTTSIRTRGVLQPILVRPSGDRFQIVAGERRWLAARQAGLTNIPCRIMPLEDRETTEAAIEENLKRQDLNALEKAQAFKDYVARYACTIDELAKKLGMQRSTVSNFIRLLDLPESVRELLRRDKLSFGHARALLPLQQEADQLALAERVQGENLSVRAVEQAVKEILRRDAGVSVPFAAGEGQSPTASGDGSGAEGANAAPVPTNHVLSLQDQLRDLLGAKVEIVLKGKEAGRVVIHFGSNDEFERILRTLRRHAEAA